MICASNKTDGEDAERPRSKDDSDLLSFIWAIWRSLVIYAHVLDGSARCLGLSEPVYHIHARTKSLTGTVAYCTLAFRWLLPPNNSLFCQ